MKTLLLVGAILAIVWSCSSCGVSLSITPNPDGSVDIGANVPPGVLLDK